MEKNNIPSIALLALLSVLLIYFLPTLLSFLVKKQKQRMRAVSGKYIHDYPTRLFFYELPLRYIISKRKMKKIRKHVTPLLQGEIFFLETYTEKKEVRRLSFEKLFYFTHKEDIVLFEKSINKFLKYELKQASK